MSKPQDTAMLDVLEQVPQLLMTVVEGIRHQQDHANRLMYISRQLNILRLISKRANLAVFQGYEACHLRVSVSVQRLECDAMRRFSHLLARSCLKHLRVSIEYTGGE